MKFMETAEGEDLGMSETRFARFLVNTEHYEKIMAEIVKVDQGVRVLIGAVIAINEYSRQYYCSRYVPHQGF